MKIAMYSNLVKTMIADDMETEHEIPLPNVKSSVLSKVLEYLKYHDNEPMYEIEKVSSSSSEVIH
jgi:S-phase kinase-associated protein 1